MYICTHVLVQPSSLVMALLPPLSTLSLQVALHFVKDERTRFALGVECGNLDVSCHAHLN